MTTDATVTDRSTYSLKFENQAPGDWDFLVFQQYFGPQSYLFASLAWFASTLRPGGTVRLEWDFQWEFNWAEVGPLSTGVIYTPAGVVPAGRFHSNTIIDFGEANGQWGFSNQRDGEDNMLMIDQIGDVPANNLASVGFGQSRRGVFAAQARPRFTVAMEPNTKYFIAATNGVREGEVLNVASLQHVQPLDFPTGVFSQTAIFDAHGTWDIKAGP